MPTDITVALITVIGAVVVALVTGLLIPALNKKKDGLDSTIQASKPIKRESKSKKARIILSWAVIGAAIFGTLAYFLFKPTFLSPCPVFESTSVTITSPASGSRVPYKNTIHGSSCNTGDKELWIVVKAQSTKLYFFQQGPVDITSDGNWSAPNIYIGSVKSVSGSGYELIPVLARTEDRNHFKAYVPHPGIGGDIYLNSLPVGVQQMPQILVERQ